MLTELVNFLADERKKLEEGVFDHPPKTMEELHDRIGQHRAFGDTLDRIEALQRGAEEAEAKR